MRPSLVGSCQIFKPQEDDLTKMTLILPGEHKDPDDGEDDEVDAMSGRGKTQNWKVS